MNWEPTYAVLMFFTTITTWLCGRYLQRNDCHRRKTILRITIIANLGVLFLFKYLNFFSENVFIALQYLGLRMTIPKFAILLPVGISFYTFQAIGYAADVYNKKEEHIRDLSEYMLFIAFFPQLVAGPIERIRHMMPQFRTAHHFSYANLEQGFMIMLWGYLLKLCLADRIAIYVDAIYNNLEMHNGGSYLLASMLFPFQIYGDFCGYSLIAVGTACMMGFHMTDNFRQPYFALSISDFWTRWHISLSTFLRDYVYIPLGGNRQGKVRIYRNIMITMLISGFWHGANWTYIVWGGIHGVIMCFERIIGVAKRKPASRLEHIARLLVTFLAVSFAFIFFRANTLYDAWTVVHGIFFDLSMPFKHWTVILASLLMIIVVLIKDYIWECKGGICLSPKSGNILKFMFSVLVICFCILFGVLDGSQFIYFQF